MGPAPRLYFSQCLQWIDCQLSRGLSDVELSEAAISDQNKYNTRYFSPPTNWHFTKSEPYKHHFISFPTQLRKLRALDGRDRYLRLSQMMRGALAHYSHEMQQRGHRASAPTMMVLIWSRG